MELPAAPHIHTAKNTHRNRINIEFFNQCAFAMYIIPTSDVTITGDWLVTHSPVI